MVNVSSAFEKHCESTASTLRKLATTIARRDVEPRGAPDAAMLLSPREAPLTVDFPQQWVALAMTDPAQARRNVEALAREQFAADLTLGDNVRVRFPLDRLVAVPHQEFWDKGSGPVVNLLERAGVEVIKTTRSDESATFGALGRYDAVIAMAGIEHIPHTRRMFLEGLVSHVRAGRVLVLDTPNIARYWNRVALAAGHSPLMDIKSQYFTRIPYEGHHREYTGPELVWMMQQAGCADVHLHYLDYNMVQFEKILRPHLECLIALVQDPTTADTLLASGLVNRP